VLSSPLESPEGSALLGFGLGQGLPWGRSPWAGSSIGGSPPARRPGAEDGAGDGAVDKGVTGDAAAVDAAATMSGSDARALAEVHTTGVSGQHAATHTELALFVNVHVAVELSSATDVLIILETSEEC